MENQDDFDLNDIIDDDSKYFGNIFEIGNNEDVNEINTKFTDSLYHTESEYTNLLQSQKITDSNNIKLLSMNIANVLTKLNSMKILIQNISNDSNRPNIISLTETHLKDNQNHGYSENEIKHLLPGYTFFHKNRKTKKGGGVGVLVENRLAAKAEIICDDLFEDEIEI